MTQVINFSFYWKMTNLPIANLDCNLISYLQNVVQINQLYYLNRNINSVKRFIFELNKTIRYSIQLTIP